MKKGLGGFFDDDDKEDIKQSAKPAIKCDDDELDPLDAFMAGVASEVEANAKRTLEEEVNDVDDHEEDELGDEDFVESYASFAQTYHQHSGKALQPQASDIDYDEDGNEINFNDPSSALTLPPLDHSLISYDVFRRNIFVPSPPATVTDHVECEELRKRLDIRVRDDLADEGESVHSSKLPPLSASWNGLGLGATLTEALQKDFPEGPTPIQCQAIPAILSGRDILGIAKTGSGKTGAFLWPLMRHMADMPPPSDRGSPFCIIMCPTRELAKQISDVCRIWCRLFRFNVVNLLGGNGTMTQMLALRESCEIVVGTPGRIIHFLRKKYLRPHLVKFLCLDEADKMLDMGFEGQVRAVCGQLRPDRITLMFSATFKPNVQHLARDLMVSPLRINVGAIGSVNKDIDQIPVILGNDQQKRSWLEAKIHQLLREGSVLIFVSQKQSADDLADFLVNLGVNAAATHGEKVQTTRNKIHFAFKNGHLQVLVATDVASRGLDIGVVKTVIQFDGPKNIDVHTHRVGRTGRAGERGTAYALITPKDTRFANILATSMTQGGQMIPPDLDQVAKLGRRHPQYQGLGSTSKKRHKSDQEVAFVPAKRK